MNRGLSFALFFLIAGYAASQSCTQRLNRAEDLYDAGRLLEIESLIANCFGNFTEGEAIRARKLLTKVAIFTDNEPKAEEELINLLTIDPVHRLQPEDPSEMTVLMSKFRTWPVYRLEAYGGVNLSMASKAQSFSTFTSDASEKDYGDSPGIGIQGGVRITKHLQDLVYGVEVGAGFEARSSAYSVKSAPESTPYETDIVNSQFMLRMPVFARYNVGYSIDGKFIPYVFLGGSLDYIVSAQYSSASRSGGTSFTLSGNDTDLKQFNQVNELGVSIIAGAGAKIGMKKGNFFFLEARFDKSIFLYNVPEERYSNQRVVGDLQYVEDDIYLDFVSIQVGYVLSIFKPEKLEK